VSSLSYDSIYQLEGAAPSLARMERTLSLSPRSSSEVSFAANAGVLAGAGALFAAALAASAAEECQSKVSVTACSSAQIGAGLPHVVRLWSDQQKMDKGQDQTYRGRSVCAETGEPFEYVMVTDGHGGDDCIRALRNIPQSLLIVMLGTKNPVEALAAHVNPRSCKHFGGGATVGLAKIFSDRVETINCGDSQVAVYRLSARVLSPSIPGSGSSRAAPSKWYHRLRCLVAIVNTPLGPAAADWHVPRLSEAGARRATLPTM
jgi:hypothetical protein